MKKRAIAILAVITATATAVAGCGYDDKSNDVSKINVDKYVTLTGDYHNLPISVDISDPVTDEDVQSYIDYEMSNHSETVKSDKTTVENGDIANIDYEGLKDGVAFEGGTAQGYDLAIGSGTFIPGFEDGLIGHSVGEEVALNITFPENYQAADLAGQPVVFNVKINYISEKKDPELTDEFVASLGHEGVTDVAGYKEYVTNLLNENASNSDLSAKRGAAQDALLGVCSFADVTRLSLYTYYVDQLRAQVQKNANQYNMSVEDVISAMYGTDSAGYEQKLAEQATILTRGALACGKIAKLEKISITDAEINEQMAKEAAEYGYQSVEDFKKAINAEDYKNYMLQMKVVDKLLETAVITDSGSGDGSEAADTEDADTAQ